MTAEKKSPLKSKTIWLGVAVGLLSGLELAQGFLSQFLTAEHAAIAGAVVGALIIVLRFLTGKPLTPPKVPGAGALWALPLAALLLTGCGHITAAERAEWSGFGRSTGAAAGKFAAEAGCAAAGLACKQKGPAWCKTVVDLGCSFGRAKLGEALDKWAAGGKPDGAFIYAEVTAAFAADPALIRYEARMRPIGDLAPACEVPAGKVIEGFVRTGTATDSKPLDVRDAAPLRETAGGE